MMLQLRQAGLVLNWRLLLIFATGIVPLADPVWAGPTSIKMDEPTPMESANIAAMSIFSGITFLALGASVGSFLNVVIYRLPHRLSLSHPPSMCPRCQTPISRRDNIPILSWFLLRGRCRACHAPIPFRYPAVEIGVGSLFVLLLFVELLSGGTNLPGDTPYLYNGVVWILWYTKWDLLGLYLFHLLLLMILTVIVLMRRDGFAPRTQPVACALVLPAGLLMLVLVTLLPHLHVASVWTPVPSWIECQNWMFAVNEPWFSGRSWNVGFSLRGLLSALSGLMVGSLLGWPVRELFHASGLEARNQSDLLMLLPLCGLCLGWQASLYLATVLVITAPAIARFAQRMLSIKVSSGDILLVLTLLLILNWGRVHTGGGLLWNRLTAGPRLTLAAGRDVGRIAQIGKTSH